MRVRPILLAAALLCVGAAAMPATASCLGSRPVTSIAPGAYSYVFSPGLCPGGICADPEGTSVSPQIEGWFWSLGLGDPAPSTGIDSGSLAAHEFFSFYPGYPAWVDTNWNDARTDGCIDSATSDEPACVALVLADREAGCDPATTSCVSLAVLTTTSSGGPIDFSLPEGAPIDLARLPAAYHESNVDGEPIASASHVVFAPTSGLYLDPACGLPIVGHRIWIARVPSGALPPEAVRDGGGFTLAHGGSGPGGEPLPLGVPATIRFGCTTDFTTAYLAHSLVFDGGFETRALSLARDVDFQPGTPCCIDADVDDVCITWVVGPPDCDDTNPAIAPGAAQVCGDGLNNNCSDPAWPSLAGTNESDDDGDGFSECAGDCEDGTPSIFPGAGLAEVCDGLDNECDGRSDEAPAFFEHIADPVGAAGGHFGVSVAGLGDVDGDGVGDFIVGARWDPVDGLAKAGSVTIFSGATRAALAKLLHPQPDAEDEFGRSVAALGDVDGDGIDDLVVGAPLDDVGGVVDAGSAHVFSGDAAAGFPLLDSLFDPAPSAGAELGYSVEAIGDLDGDLALDLVVGARGDGGVGSASVFSGATATRLRKLVDPEGQAGDLFGYAVGGIQDVDGDDVPDILVGAHLADAPEAADAGKVMLFSGAGGGVVRTLADPTGAPGDEFGRSLTAVSDIDGDGIEDLLIGAPEAGGTGQALVFSGASGAFVDRASDPDGQPDDGFGYRVDRSGDLDGDAVGDAVVGAFRDDGAAGANTGSATVLSMATRSVIAKLGDPAAAPFDLFGLDVAAIDDLDGDGRPEILVGAYLRDTLTGADAGEAVLFHGAAVEDLDGDATGDRCDDDMDGDGVANDIDCAPRNVSVAAPPPEITGLRFSGDKTELRWDDAPDSTVYDVFRGPLSAGLDGAECVWHDRIAPLVSTETPAPDEGHYYVLRGTNDCGTGALGPGAGGTERVPGSECP